MTINAHRVFMQAQQSALASPVNARPPSYNWAVQVRLPTQGKNHSIYASVLVGIEPERTKPGNVPTTCLLPVCDETFLMKHLYSASSGGLHVILQPCSFHSHICLEAHLHWY